MADELDQVEQKSAKQSSGFIARVLWIAIIVIGHFTLTILAVIVWNLIQDRDNLVDTKSLDELEDTTTFSQELRDQSLGEFTVQLTPAAGETNPGIIKVTVGIGFSESDSDMEEKLKEHEHEISNAAQRALASFRASQLSTPDGKQMARNYIKAALNEFLGQNGEEVVKQVYLTNISINTGR